MQFYESAKFESEVFDYLKNQSFDHVGWGGVIHEGENVFIDCNQPPSLSRRQKLIGDFHGLNKLDKIIISGVRRVDIRTGDAKKEPMTFAVMAINNKREIEIAPRMITSGKYRNVDCLPNITHPIIKLSRNR